MASLTIDRIAAFPQPAAAPNETTDPRPIIVLGALRSGASLLALSLAQHSTIVQVQESLWLEQFAINLQQTFVEATSNAMFSRLLRAGVDRDAFFAQFGNAFDRLFLGQGTATRWLDATYTHAFIVLPLARLFPHGRFIHVLRDVDGVVNSLTSDDNRLSYRSHYQKFTVQDAYEHWLDVVTTCVEAERCLGSASIMRIRRDDLVRHPECTLHRCFDFIGETFDPACLRPFAGLDVPAETPAPPPPPDGAVSRSLIEVFSRTLFDEGTPNFPGDGTWRARRDDAFNQRCAAASRAVLQPDPTASSPRRADSPRRA